MQGLAGPSRSGDPIPGETIPTVEKRLQCVRILLERHKIVKPYARTNAKIGAMRVLLFCLLAWLCGVRADDGANEARGLPRVKAKAKAKPRALPKASVSTHSDGPSNGGGSGQLSALMPEAKTTAMPPATPSTLGQQQYLMPKAKAKAKAKAKPRALPRGIATNNDNNIGNNQPKPLNPSSGGKASSTTNNNGGSGTQPPKIKPKRRAKTKVTSTAKFPTTITTTWSVHQRLVNSTAPINAVDIPCPGMRHGPCQVHSFTHLLTSH